MGNVKPFPTEARLKPAPHSAESEMALIGALLHQPESWPKVSSRISAEDFFRRDTATIFAAISERNNRRETADAVAVVDCLRKSGRIEEAGGQDFLVGLMESSLSASNVAVHADRVRRYAQLRSLYGMLTDSAAAVMDATSEDVADLVARTAEGLLKLQSDTRTGRGLVDAQRIMRDLIDELDRRSNGEQGLSIGLPDFDALSFGLEPGDLVVLAGRPGMGKTALLVSIAAHVSRDQGVAIFSAEMSSAQLMRRTVALLGKVSQGHLRRAEQITDEEWTGISDAATAISRRRLWIDDTPAPKLSHISAETLALAARSKIGLVMVDYVQLVQGTGANRYEQLRDVAYGLKALAKDAGIPIVLLAQLNRGVESRTGDQGKRARLSDLRDSGAIEEAADIVGMLYSEGYYDPDFPMPNVLECAIEKNRHGERGECLWHFSGAYSRVGALDERARADYRRYRSGRRGGRDDDL